MSRFWWGWVLVLGIVGWSGSDRAARAEEADTDEVGASAVKASMELQTGRPTISLNGTWDFSYDPKDVGQQERWFAARAELPEKTTVPGCDQAAHHPSSGMSEQDYTEFHEKHNEFMMDARWPTRAAAWHRKRFTIPAAWRGREIWLHLGRGHAGGRHLVQREEDRHTLTSRGPVRCELTDCANFGGENCLVIRTHWPDGPRMDGLFTSLAGFSGLYRGARVEVVSPTHVREVHIVGQIDPPGATVHFTLAGAAPRDKPIEAVCEITGRGDRKKYSAHVTIAPDATAATHSIKLNMPDARLWSPQEPRLYRAEITLREGDRELDTAAVRFGLREIRCEGLRILLNGRPLFLRGGCDDHVYPATLSPPASKEFYLARLRKAKQYGFNYTKSCMEIFTDEFLEAADEVGLMVCQEMPTGLTGKYRKATRENLSEAYRELYRREVANIVRSDRNHPSVVLYSMISEAPLADSALYGLFSRELPEQVRRLNPTALVMDVTSTAGDWTGNTSFGPRQTDIIEETAGKQFWQEPLSHPIQGRYGELNRPFILHEYNWWTSLPEPSLAARYEGLPVKLGGVPELEEAARQTGLADQLPTFVDRSKKLKRRLQKYGLELARRNPKISGYHFWLIHGFLLVPRGPVQRILRRPGRYHGRGFSPLQRRHGASAGRRQPAFVRVGRDAHAGHRDLSLRGETDRPAETLLEPEGRQ